MSDIVERVAPEDDGDVDDAHALDAWIAPSLRTTIERRFWAPIERLTSLEAMVADPAFVAQPGLHLGLYSDHGPNHARDVAMRSAEIAEWAIGTLVPPRDSGRSTFVSGVAVLISLLHDVGMCVDPPVGRALHAQWAAQLMFSASFADVLDDVLDTDAGGLLTGLHRAGVDDAHAPRVAREVLACTVAHSKSAVPPAFLEDRSSFRALLQYVERTDLEAQLGVRDRTVDDDGSFTWLVDSRYAELAADVVDALRIVRAADALRQRGTTLRTSSGFEIVVDARSGGAVAVLRSATQRSAFLLEVDSPIVVGESNIRAAELAPDGLRFQFHRGAFATDDISDAVAAAVASIIDDIQRDILPSFPSCRFEIAMLTPDDDERFAERVREKFIAVRPELTDHAEVAAGRSTCGRPPAFDWLGRGRVLTPDRASGLRAELDAHGVRGAADDDALFEDVVVVDVEPGESLMSPGEEASFVVVPLGDGLEITPLGGYCGIASPAYVPIGTIGVLRGHDRNSTVVAAEALEVLVVPSHAYLARWARPFDPRALVERVTTGPLT